MSIFSRAWRAARQALTATGSGASARSAPATPQRSVATGTAPTAVVEYDGALPQLEYSPRPDHHADPGEIVWAWVPYDENDGRGKDRPVLVIARHASGYLGLQTTSKDHDRDQADEAHWGRYWFDIGSGAWDRQGRPSEVRLDRVLYLPAGAVRREGAGLDKALYDAVVAALTAMRREQAR